MPSHSKVKLGQGSCFSKSNEDSGVCKDSEAEYGDYPRDTRETLLFNVTKPETDTDRI